MRNLYTIRETAPFRYDIVGSFLRPEKLKTARLGVENGSLSKEQLTAVEDPWTKIVWVKEIALAVWGE